MDDFKYEIVEELGVLKECKTKALLVNIVSFNGGKPKIDIRWWTVSRDGSPTQMGKGVALAEDERKKLKKILEELDERDN